MAEVKMGWMPSFPSKDSPIDYYKPIDEVKETDEEVFQNIFSVKEDEEYDESFEEWLKELSELSPEESKDFIWKLLESRMGEDDVKCCRKIVNLLENEMDSSTNTDLVYIENILKKDYPEITPFAVFDYLILLQGLGMIKLEQ